MFSEWLIERSGPQESYGMLIPLGSFVALSGLAPRFPSYRDHGRRHRLGGFGCGMTCLLVFSCLFSLHLAVPLLKIGWDGLRVGELLSPSHCQTRRTFYPDTLAPRI